MDLNNDQFSVSVISLEDDVHLDIGNENEGIILTLEQSKKFINGKLEVPDLDDTHRAKMIGALRSNLAIVEFEKLEIKYKG